MKRIFAIIPLFSSLAFASVGFSLDELIDSAFRHSHTIAVADMRIAQNTHGIEEAQRNILPQILFTGNHGYAFTPFNPMVAMAGEAAAGMFRIPRHQLTGGLDFRQTIFAQRRLSTSLEQARVRGRGLICQWQEARMHVRANMTRKYYSALIARRRVEIEDRSRSIAQARHLQTISRFESMQLSELDTLNSFIDLSQAQLRLREAERVVRENLRAIATAAGLSTHLDDIVLTDTLFAAVAQIDYDLLMRQFLSRNTQLRALQTEVNLVQLQVQLARGEHLPQIFGGLQLNRAAHFNNRGDFNFLPERRVYLGIIYDLTPFGSRGLRVRQAEFDLRIAQRNLERRREELILTLTSYYERLKEEIERIEESRSIRNAAERALILAQSRYAGGLISQTDMETSEQQFRNSDLAYLQAVFNYNSLLIELRIIGADYLFDSPRNIERQEN